MSKYTAEEVPADFCAGRLDGNYAHPTDPTIMVTCVAQTHCYFRDCPPGMVFSERDGECVWPGDAAT
ncbi:MAG: chitinase [bacterium]|jgi:hypothetical protein